jgi:hypothetical protein
MLAVVITAAAAKGEFRFARYPFGTVDSEWRSLAGWLGEEQGQEAVRESTAEARFFRMPNGWDAVRSQAN